jgi:hypothetical protein
MSIGRSEAVLYAAAVVARFERDIASGAKAHVALRPILYGLKPVPFKLSHYRRRSSIAGKIETAAVRSILPFFQHFLLLRSSLKTQKPTPRKGILHP